MQPLTTITPYLPAPCRRGALAPGAAYLARQPLAWGYWALTLTFLATGLTVWSPAIALALLVADLQLIHFRLRLGRWSAFPVQVRLAFLIVLTLGCLDPLGFLHWLVIVGTTLRLGFDYCLLARLLSLLTWNRRGPLDALAVRRALSGPRTVGSVLSADSQGR